MVTINETEELIGWKAIADFIQVSESTARRWRHSLGLPAYRLGGQIRANPEKVKKWREKRENKRV